MLKIQNALFNVIVIVTISVCADKCQNHSSLIPLMYISAANCH